MQCKSVACCQFNLDRMTSVCLSKRERESDREVNEAELRSWTFNPLSVPNYLSLIHLSAICLHLTISLLYHLSVSCSSTCTFGVVMNTFCISFSCCEFPLTPCLLHPPCTLCTNPPFTLLYLPLLCALPSLPSLHPSPPCKVVPKDGMLPASPASLADGY